MNDLNRVDDLSHRYHDMLDGDPDRDAHEAQTWMILAILRLDFSRQDFESFCAAHEQGVRQLVESVQECTVEDTPTRNDIIAYGMHVLMSRPDAGLRPAHAYPQSCRRPIMERMHEGVTRLRDLFRAGFSDQDVFDAWQGAKSQDQMIALSCAGCTIYDCPLNRTPFRGLGDVFGALQHGNPLERVKRGMELAQFLSNESRWLSKLRESRQTSFEYGVTFERGDADQSGPTIQIPIVADEGQQCWLLIIHLGPEHRYIECTERDQHGDIVPTDRGHALIETFADVVSVVDDFCISLLDQTANDPFPREDRATA